MPKYRVTVTRGTTESVVVVVEADNADQAEDLALADAGPDLEWTVDAGAYDDPYIGSPGDAELLEEGSRTMTQQSKPVNLDNATFVVHGEQLIAAVESAVLKSAMWQAAGVTRDNGDMWHFAKVECMLIPGAWEHMGRRMQRDGNSGSFAYYQKPARAEDERGLPGYTMAPWVHESAHASIVWDGIRRELYGGLGEALYMIAQHLYERRPGLTNRCTTCDKQYGSDCAEGRCSRYRGYQPEYMRDQLAHYRVRVPELEAMCQ
jgi:hypothetical protein